MAGSSTIVFSTGQGPNGPRGNTGNTGPIGNTGESFTGGTGTGVTGITLNGLTFTITYGTGGNTYAIPSSYIVGPGGDLTTGPTDRTYYTLQGITTTGYSIIRTSNIAEGISNSVNYTGSELGFAYAYFNGLTLNGISYSIGANTITITGITNEPNSDPSYTTDIGVIGNLAYSKTTTSVGTLSLSTWDSTNQILQLNTSSFREVDISGNTHDRDNYRADSIGTLTSESQFVNMSIAGYTANCKYARPLTTINGSTLQSALYITNGSTANYILYFGKQTGNQIAERITLSPQTSTITYGSCCLPSGKCIDYATEKYCNYLNGSFSAGIRCEENTIGNKSCCYYDIESNGVICINTRPEECLCFLGQVGLTLCEELNGCTAICGQGSGANLGLACYDAATNSLQSILNSSIIGACCTAGDCVNTTALYCDSIHGVFKGPQSTCSECAS